MKVYVGKTEYGWFVEVREMNDVELTDLVSWLFSKLVCDSVVL